MWNRWPNPRAGVRVVTLLLLVMLCTLAPLSTGAVTDEAAEGATIVIHHRFCPEGYGGTSFYEDCHDNAGWVGVPFYVSDTASDMYEINETREDGNVTFGEIPAGRYRVSREPFLENLVVPLVFCADAAAPGVEILSAVDPGWIELDLAAGDRIICDWYSTPRVGWSPGRYPLPIRVYACDSDPGGIGIAMGGLPEECRGAPGVTVRITTLDDKPIGRCITGQGGGCEVPTPFAFNVRAELDPATLPAGYQPQWNPHELWVYTEYAAAIFVLLPGKEE